MEIILSFLAKLFGGVFTDWLEGLRKQQEAEAKGAATQQLKQKELDDARIREAARARDSIKPDVNVPDDPDFRD